MKKIFSLILAMGMCAAASAQYICTVPGTSMEYQVVVYHEGDSTVINSTAQVLSATDNGGVVTVLTRESAPLPGTSFGEKVDTTTTVYTAADKTTKFILSTPEEAKKEVIDMIKMQIEAAGQAVGVAEMDDFISSIRAKGELSLAISPDMAPGTKLPNKNMRITVGQETMSYNIWEAKVVGTESVTTPAGAFDCLKVSYVNRVSAGSENQKINVTEWYAPSVGAVMSEQSLKGKPLMRQTLVKISNPQ